jgi:hypothetical protein
MAVDSYDPTTGRPIFLDTGAPDIGVDPTEVGKYAADVGNSIIRDSYLQLAAYPYAREGLSGYTTDTGNEYLYNGAGWEIVGGSPTAWMLPTLATGWAATTLYTPTVKRIGLQVWLRGAVTSTGGSPQTMLTIPEGFRPSVRQWLPTAKSSGTGYGPLNVDLAGVVGIPAGYQGGAFATGNVVPVIGTWFLD